MVPSYTYANGNPAVGLVLNVRKAYGRAPEVYCGKGAQQDLFRYYVLVVLQNGWSTGRIGGSTGPGEGDKVYL